LKNRLSILLVLGLLSSCSFRPPQNIPTFINRAGETSCNIVTRLDYFEAQMAFSPVKYLLLLGEVKSESMKDNSNFARHSAGIGLYYPLKKKKITFELIHFARQFERFGGPLHGLMTVSNDKILSHASGNYDFTQTRFAFYKITPENYRYGVSLNYIDCKYFITGASSYLVSQYYIRDEPYRIYALNISLFSSFPISKYVDFVHSLSLSRTRLQQTHSPSVAIFSPFSYRFGVSYYLDRKKK